MKIVTHLNFSGECRTAFGFYADLMGGEIVALTPFSETPMADHFGAEWREKIWHGHIRIGGIDLMATDAPPALYTRPQGFAVALHVGSDGEAERIFDGLLVGGEVTVPLTQNSWASRFGILKDRFGTPWIVTHG
ncbi:VOC family protein [Ferrovibrio sp.]|uniref:VOC family protein n=1 Tax=Ferrovibrio sp. TaxID=1917215 RepID=UPI0035AED662